MKFSIIVKLLLAMAVVGAAAVETTEESEHLEERAAGKEVSLCSTNEESLTCSQSPSPILAGLERRTVRVRVRSAFEQDRHDDAADSEWQDPFVLGTTSPSSRVRCVQAISLGHHSIHSCDNWGIFLHSLLYNIITRIIRVGEVGIIKF